MTRRLKNPSREARKRSAKGSPGHVKALRTRDALAARVHLERKFKALERGDPMPIPGGFKAPFRYDGIAYIWDADGEMACDFRDEGAVRARGWGRIQYLPEVRGGAAANVIMADWIAWVERVAGGMASPELVVERMNVAAREALDTPVSWG